MSPGLVVAMVIGSILAVVLAALWGVAFQRWTFEHGGHTFVVTNYGLRETVAVDGQIVPTVRTSSGMGMRVEHRVEVDGEPVRILIGTENGLTVRCRAAAGQAVIYDSDEAFPDLVKARAPSAPVGRAAEPDPRVSAARVLLAELAGHEDAEVREATGAVREAVTRAFDRLQRAVASSEAHAALGGEAAGEVLAPAETEVAEVLETLRALHLAAQRIDATHREEIPAVRAVTGRLQAEREVDNALRARQAAARARKQG